MKKFDTKDRQLFEYICKLNQDELLQMLTAFLYKHYPKVEATQEYVFAAGDIPIALVAHLDTVFKETPKEIYYDERQGVMWSPQGLGADDRAGVFAIIKIIQAGFKPHIIFTTEEEIGGIGAQWLVYDYPESPFDELKYIIELDRRNKNDACFYECINQEFIHFIENADFYETSGIYSDIYELCPAWEVAGVNLSVGYVDEHLEIERLYIPALLNTIEQVKWLLTQDTGTFKWECLPELREFLKKRKYRIHTYSSLAQKDGSINLL